MIIHCDECGASHALDDRLAAQATITLCPECGNRCSVAGGKKTEDAVPSASFTIRKPSGEKIVATDVAEIQALLAMGVLVPTDVLEAESLPPRSLAETEGFGPFVAGHGAADRHTPPYGVASSREAAPHSRDAVANGRLSVGSSARFAETIRPQPAPVDTLRPQPAPSAPPGPVAKIAISSDLSAPTRPASWRTEAARPLPSPPRTPRVTPSGPASARSLPGARDVSSSPSIKARAMSSDPRPSPTPTAPTRRSAKPSTARPSFGVVAATLVAVGAAAAVVIALREREPRGQARAAEELVQTGEAALSSGQLDLAKESFDKAVLLSPGSGRLLLGAARVANAQADEEWLRKRLLPAEERDEQRRTEQSLVELSSRANVLASRALATAPSDLTAVALSVDALRLGGDLERARRLADQLPASATDHESAYVRGMLGVVDDHDISEGAVALLRHASLGTWNPTRARSALAYALARRGDVAGARAECDKLSSLTQAAPLVGALRAFIERTAATSTSTATPVAAAAGPRARVEATSPPAAEPKKATSTDLLREAESDLRAGKLERAKHSYTRLLQTAQGHEIEAHLGLARVAKAEGDVGGARREIEAAVALQPHATRARLALADLDWDSGDLDAARRRYRELVDESPDGHLPARVRERAAPAAVDTHEPASGAPSTAPDPH